MRIGDRVLGSTMHLHLIKKPSRAIKVVAQLHVRERGGGKKKKERSEQGKIVCYASVTGWIDGSRDRTDSPKRRASSSRTRRHWVFMWFQVVNQNRA